MVIHFLLEQGELLYAGFHVVGAPFEKEIESEIPRALDVKIKDIAVLLFHARPDFLGG
jgi:hypothetical protein